MKGRWWPSHPYRVLQISLEVAPCCAPAGLCPEAKAAMAVSRRQRDRYTFAEDIHRELMTQDWVTRHNSLRNLQRNDPSMWLHLMRKYLSPSDAVKGLATGRTRLLWKIPLGYIPRRKLTLCKLFGKKCRCTIRQ